jgi:hypothetical protein
MGKRLVEDCLTLDLAWLMRLAPIRAGQAGSGEIKWSRDGNVVGSARFQLDLRETENARLLLRYCPAEHAGERKAAWQAIWNDSTSRCQFQKMISNSDFASRSNSLIARFVISAAIEALSGGDRFGPRAANKSVLNDSYASMN